MNWRKPAYLSYASLRGYRFPTLLRQYLAQYEAGIAPQTAPNALSGLLLHCQQMVPYYTELLSDISPNQIRRNPCNVLHRLPVLTKELIRANFNRLQSEDNSQRNCQTNTSGGSTGEPVQLIQDDEYRDASAAIQWLSHHQLGCSLGAPHVRLWGSERDLESGTKSPKARFFNWLTNTTWMNAFAMSPERMREFIDTLNRTRPRLVVAYAQAIYELARFAERQQIPVAPQRAVLTSAGTLYPFMREKIAQVFRCEVYNLYGSREVSDIAWELPGLKGLWAPPWANFIEIVDENGAPVPAGTEGNILVTCLTNYAMPLVRYCIGDRGALLPESEAPQGVQMLSHVSGRTVDTFRRSDQTLIDGEYFTHLLYFRPWLWKFQVVQKSYNRILFRLVSTNGKPPTEELDEIASRSRLAMGEDCNVEFEFCDELPPLRSGKFRYTISEVCV
jgi:phenylacetate-coenzyme A ligase PaaK-like adenylate-forming protein